MRSSLNNFERWPWKNSRSNLVGMLLGLYLRTLEGKLWKVFGMFFEEFQKHNYCNAGVSFQSNPEEVFKGTPSSMTESRLEKCLQDFLGKILLTHGRIPKGFL